MITKKTWDIWRNCLFSEWFVLGIGATPIFLIILAFSIMADTLAFLWFVCRVVAAYFLGYCHKCGHYTVDHRGATCCPKCDLK